AGNGTIDIKTASGGNVMGTGGAGISTTAVSGTTTISIGGGSTVTGTSAAISATTTNGNVTVSNAYAGTVQGSINAVLTGAGTGTFTFNNSGTLAILGAQSNTGFALNNMSGGVLTGTGSFGAVDAASGSIIRPGDRTLALVSGAPVMGTLNASSLTLASGAIVEIRANFTSGADKIAVTGAAVLGGATLKVAATPQIDATWSSAKSFTILTGGSVTGTFATTQLDYAFLKATLAYTSTSVSMTLDRNWTSFGAYSTTPNQKSVSDVFDTFQTQGTNPLIAKVSTLTISQAPVAMSQLSGTGVATARTQSFAASGLFNGALSSEMSKFTGSASGGAVLSYADDKKLTKAFDKVAAKPAEPILDGRVWAHVLGGVANMKSDATNPSERSTNFGLAAGIDTAINPNLRAGFALSGGQSVSKVASLAISADANWGQAALYGVATDGDRYAKAALVYGYLSTETQRTVTAFSTSETAKGKFGANLFSTRLEVGQKFVTGGPVNVTPFFAFEPAWLVQNAYSETGAAPVALGYVKTTTRALPTTLGMKFDGEFALDTMRVAPSATLGWVHNFADTSSLSPFFTALPGSTFTVAGAKGDRDLARTEVNVEATPEGSTATFYANARADLGARTNAVRGTAGAMLRF
ncbi:MAG: putative outer rane autotransporter barrel precursor, partial [Hyphomicrobiales bacterium]|nr:putative outer rane autotransporter barrel precursor [Hyphomicrobiales bacterium]